MKVSRAAPWASAASSVAEVPTVEAPDDMVAALAAPPVPEPTPERSQALARRTRDTVPPTGTAVSTRKVTARSVAVVLAATTAGETSAW